MPADASNEESLKTAFDTIKKTLGVSWKFKPLLVQAHSLLQCRRLKFSCTMRPDSCSARCSTSNRSNWKTNPAAFAHFHSAETVNADIFKVGCLGALTAAQQVLAAMIQAKKGTILVRNKQLASKLLNSHCSLASSLLLVQSLLCLVFCNLLSAEWRVIDSCS